MARFSNCDISLGYSNCNVSSICSVKCKSYLWPMCAASDRKLGRDLGTRLPRGSYSVKWKTMRCVCVHRCPTSFIPRPMSVFTTYGKVKEIWCYCITMWECGYNAERQFCLAKHPSSLSPCRCGCGIQWLSEGTRCSSKYCSHLLQSQSPRQDGCPKDKSAVVLFWHGMAGSVLGGGQQPSSVRWFINHVGLQIKNSWSCSYN